MKILHHAVFDLSFLRETFGLRARTVTCTKVAAKLLFPHQPERHSLAPLVHLLLGTTMDKTQQLSDWSQQRLSDDQLRYAARDVEFLPDLLDVLRSRLDDAGLTELAQACWQHLPTRVELEYLSVGDVFAY